MIDKGMVTKGVAAWTLARQALRQRTNAVLLFAIFGLAILKMRLQPSYFTNYAVRHLGNNIWELASPNPDGFAKPRMHRAITPAFPRISKPINFFPRHKYVRSQRQR
jgi:hypothetical protein